MKITRTFSPGDRYRYDFDECTTSKGFAQVDTSQDASYFGTWTNPFTLTTICYCEGDVTKSQAETLDEYTEDIHAIKAWNTENGHRFKGIDPGFNESLIAEFHKIGLAELLH